MSTRLAILGTLHAGPQHGYEINRRIIAQMGAWVDIAQGSIYYALRKLEQEGLIEKTSIVHQGERSITTYALTPTGRQEFLYELEDTLRYDPGMYFDLDIGLSFLTSLPLGTRLEALQDRLDDLEDIRADIARQRVDALELDRPRLAQAIFDHALYHYKVEIIWLGELLEAMRAGLYEQSNA